MQGHWGCPECGCDKFRSWQGYTEWGSEKVYCKYTGDTEDDEEYEIDDYGDRTSSDGESGEMEDTRECMDCGHEYKQPEFFPDAPESDLEEVLGQEMADKLQLVLKTSAPHAISSKVERKPWATLIHPIPKKQMKGVHPRNKHSIEVCPRCGGDMSQSTICNVEANTLVRGTPERIYDQGVQVVLVIPLCRKCNPQD